MDHGNGPEQWTRAMNLKDKTTIITGAAQGIGATLARRFAYLGANVVLADKNGELVQSIADEIGGVAVTCDVTREQDIQAAVATAEDRFGQVDLFCSNAGLYIDEPDHAASLSNAAWQTCWDVHVMSHVYAARAVLPSMIDRGDGYLLNMSSAAGLLSQIANAAYSTTKHAAIGFAESLAISHGDEGIKVSVICPQYVATPLIGYSDTVTDDLPGSTISVDQVADAVVEGIRRETFLILPHPDVAKYIQYKTADYDKWLQSMQKLRANVLQELGTSDIKDMHKLI